LLQGALDRSLLPFHAGFRMSTLHIVETSRDGLGRWLRRARKARGLTLVALAAQTKIPRGHLEALERGEPSRLPAFYQRAEVRAVARAVGVDERHAVARLESFVPPVEPELPPAPEPDRRVRSEYVLLAGTAVLVAWMLGWGPFARTGSSIAPAEMPNVAAASAVESLLPVQPPPLVQAAETAPVPQPTAIRVGTELEIRTQPEGARVTVDGIGWGVSPVTIKHIEPGDKRVRVTMDGYRAVERSVAVDEGAREAVNVRLTEFRAP
jgi:transcriptional regulator with XRE-family HTH domain